MHYINYYFKNLVYDDTLIMGHFYVSPCDGDVECDFTYDIKTKQISVYNCNKSEQDILPLPIGFLLYKLETNGHLNINESKISY